MEVIKIINVILSLIWDLGAFSWAAEGGLARAVALGGTGATLGALFATLAGTAAAVAAIFAIHSRFFVAIASTLTRGAVFSTTFAFFS